MIFERWFGLDPGSHTFRIYDYTSSRQASVRSLYGMDNGQIESVGQDALLYTYKEKPRYQVRWPLQDDGLHKDLGPLIAKAMEQAGGDRYFFKPSFLVALDDDADLRTAWKEALLACGAKKVEFVEPLTFLQVQEEGIFIQAGYAHTRIGLYTDKGQAAKMKIDWGGLQIAMAIEQMLLKEHRFLISDEDALQLLEQSSALLNAHVNGQLQVYGMFSNGTYGTLSLRALQLWPCMRDVFEQIVHWTRSLLTSLPKQEQEQLLEKGIVLSGGLASAFGLEGMLGQFFECPITKSGHPDLDVLENMKGWK